MTDLLTPAKVREVLGHTETFNMPMIATLCRDYLTLWDRHQECEVRWKDLMERYTAAKESLRP